MAQKLIEQLNECSKQFYPLHMPGHKRRFDPTGGALPVGIDITEIPGMDDLHHAEGILSEAQKRTASLYCAGTTRYLLNGSTVGILAAIRAVLSRNGEIIAARNCHKSVFHAIELMNLTAHYLMPEILSSYDVSGSIRPEAVREAVTRYPRAGAVILTSPTYEGIVSDITSIARICHDAGIPLIVDEAHGAHLIECFRKNSFWPRGAVAAGADLVIQSAHKTLPSLTQTAWLHINGNLVTPGRVDHELDVFETSSPSYPLMASLDACTGELLENGEKLFADWERNLRQFEEKTAGLKNLKIPGQTQHGLSAVYDYDPGKILVSGRCLGLTGADLAGILRNRYGFETEMAVGYNVLAMTSPADDPDELLRFADALLSIDRNVKEIRTESAAEPLPYIRVSEPEETIAEAMEGDSERIPSEMADTRIAAEYIWAYPPGVPLIVPGEKITQEHLRAIGQLKASGTEVYHMGRSRGETEDGTILVVRN